MPTYEYRCSNGHQFELFQRISDQPVGACPECGEKAERVISGGAGFLFKGEGFYITDSRSDDYKKKAAREAPSSGAEGGEKKKSGEDAGSPAKKSGGGDTAGSGDTSSSSPG